MKLRSLATLAALSLLAGVAACATATPYQPAVRGSQVSGGFSDVRVADNRFRVTFAGNTVTSRETVERYLLYRAAELTTNAGYDWFEIADKNVERDQRTYIDPTFGPYGGYGWGPYGYGYPGFGYWRPAWRFYGAGWGAWGPYYDPFGGSYDVRTVRRFEATADILLHKGPAPSDNPASFDARQVMSNLGPTLQRPAA